MTDFKQELFLLSNNSPTVTGSCLLACWAKLMWPLTFDNWSVRCPVSLASCVLTQITTRGISAFGPRGCVHRALKTKGLLIKGSLGAKCTAARGDSCAASRRQCCKVRKHERRNAQTAQPSTDALQVDRSCKTRSFPGDTFWWEVPGQRRSCVHGLKSPLRIICELWFWAVENKLD